MKTPNQIGCSFFFSWRLWRYLFYPPETPVFWRVIKKSFKHRWAAARIGLLALVVASISYGISVYLMQFNLYFPVLLLVVLAIFSSAITGIWIVDISLTIAHEHQQATYDLICMTPSGPLGADWSLATGVIHRNDRFSLVDWGRRVFSGLILLVLLMTLLPITLHSSWHHFVELLQLLFDIVFFALFSYIEHVQSVVLGVLIAMLIPRYIHQITDVHIVSVVVFIILQIIMLTIFLVVGLHIRSYFSSSDWQFRTILPQMMLLYAMRESCIYIVWKLFSGRSPKGCW